MASPSSSNGGRVSEALMVPKLPLAYHLHKGGLQVNAERYVYNCIVLPLSQVLRLDNRSTFVPQSKPPQQCPSLLPIRHHPRCRQRVFRGESASPLPVLRTGFRKKLSRTPEDAAQPILLRDTHITFSGDVSQTAACHNLIRRRTRVYHVATCGFGGQATDLGRMSKTGQCQKK